MIDLLQIQENIRQYVVETSYASNEQIKNNTHIFAEGIMDSMGFISIIGFIEEKFSVSLAGEELIEANFESINAISNFVLQKLQA